MRLTTHLHLLPRLKMSGALLPLITCAFMARKGKIIPLLHFIIFCIVSHLVFFHRQCFDTCNCFHHQTRSFLLSRPTLSKPLTVSLESVSSIHGLYKGRFTHSMPCPCRAHAVPLPCHAPALLRQCRVLRESPRGSRKYPTC